MNSIAEIDIDRLELKGMLEHILALNKKRVDLLLQNCSSKEKELLELLPFFFHVNHPTLPGFISTECPSGLASFSPSDAIIRLAKKYARSLNYQHRAARRIDIEGIYLMGSAGSVAHTGYSDLDIWVIYRPDLAKPELEQLKQKRNKIQKWASQLAIDCTIYLVSTEQIIDHQAENKSETATLGLLLDEFYRTQIYLAGRYLLWWLVPQNYHSHYQEYAEKLVRSRFVAADEFIDFGPVPSIELKEFITHSLWYINKALTSPYKTALKLVLMESYLSEYPKLSLLSDDYKQYVYAMLDNPTVIDSYLLMHRKVEDYLQQQNDHERLEFIRRCMYQKIRGRAQQLQSVSKLRQSIINELVNEWHWQPDKVAVLDQRQQWSIEQIGNEKHLYVKQLIVSFKTMVDFIRKDPVAFAEHQAALSILHRKISASLEQTTGKVERININFVPNLSARHLSITRQTKAKNLDLWSFYDRAVSQQEANVAEPVYQCASLIELLVWAEINGVLNEQTSIQFRDAKQQLQYGELEKLINVLLKSKYRGSVVDDEAFRHKPQVKEIHCFINVAQDKLTRLAKQGIHIITRHNDPFCFGEECHNLIETIDLYYENSWGEPFVVHFKGADAVTETLLALIQFIRYQKQVPKISCHSFSMMRSDDLVKRLNVFFRQALAFFYQPHEQVAKFVYRLGAEYRVVINANEHTLVKKALNEIELNQLIVAENQMLQKLDFDPRCFSDSVIRSALQSAKPNRVTLVVSKQHAPRISYAFVDECGGLSYGWMSEPMLDQELALMHRCIAKLQQTSTIDWAYYELHSDHKLTPFTPLITQPNSQSDLIDVSLIIDSEDNDGIGSITLCAQGKSFTIALDYPDLAAKVTAWVDRAFAVDNNAWHIVEIEFHQPLPNKTSAAVWCEYLKWSEKLQQLH